MPKLIDHHQREQAITRAAWAVLTRDGLLAMSVRNVADEAGIATASLRRAFPTQAALRSYCLDQIRDRVARRLQAVDPLQEPAEYVLAALAELLPLDAERCTELEVQVILGSLAYTDAGIAGAYQRADRDLRDLCRQLVAHLGSAEGYEHLRADLDAHAETLHALLDGVALHLLRDPRREDEKVRAGAQDVLRRYLASLRECP